MYFWWTNLNLSVDNAELAIDEAILYSNLHIFSVENRKCWPLLQEFYSVDSALIYILSLLTNHYLDFLIFYLRTLSINIIIFIKLSELFWCRHTTRGSKANLSSPGNSPMKKWRGWLLNFLDSERTGLTLNLMFWVKGDKAITGSIGHISWLTS